MATLGGRLRAALNDRRRSAAQLAADLSVNSGVVSKWLNDKQEPSADSLARICLALGISGHWLLTETGPMDAPGQDIGDVRAQALELARVEITERVAAAIAQALSEEPADPAAKQIFERLVPANRRSGGNVKRGRGDRRRAS